MAMQSAQANIGSVRPEKVRAKNKGEATSMIGAMIAAPSSMRLAMRWVRKRLPPDSKALKTLIPVNPNRAKGEASSTNKGFAQ